MLQKERYANNGSPAVRCALRIDSEKPAAQNWSTLPHPVAGSVPRTQADP